MDHRSFPEAADGRPSLPMEPELWAAGCDMETARFVARQLAAQGYTLVRVEDQDAKIAEVAKIAETAIDLCMHGHPVSALNVAKDVLKSIT